jgi:hypothetical protein
MNQHLVLPLVILALCGIAAALIKAFRGTGAAAKYEATPSLATPAELLFLRTLELAVDPKHRIFAKVRLIDVITPSRSLSKERAHIAKNKVIAKHLDFVICEASSLKILYAVELNDSSHKLTHRKTRDQFVADAMAGAGVPLIFVTARRTYSVEELKRQLTTGTQADGLSASTAPGAVT